MVALSITQEVKESNVSKMVYDPQSNSFVETEGWRSWGIITCCSSYLLALVIMAWYAIVGLLFVLPYIVIAIVVGLAVYWVLGGLS